MSAQVSLYRWAGSAAVPLARLNFTVEVSELQINDDYLAVICSGAAAMERLFYAASNQHPGHRASPEQSCGAVVRSCRLKSASIVKRGAAQLPTFYSFRTICGLCVTNTR